MKRLAVLLCILCLTLPSAAEALTYIYSCGALDTPYETYVVERDIGDKTGDCLEIDATGVSLIGGGYAITCSTGACSQGIDAYGRTGVMILDVEIIGFETGIRAGVDTTMAEVVIDSPDWDGGDPTYGINAWDSTGIITVEDSTFTGSPAWGILSYANDVRIHDNTFDIDGGGAGYHAITLHDVSGASCIVEGNTITVGERAWGIGVTSSASPGCLFFENTITNNHDDALDGFDLFGAEYNTFEDNTITWASGGDCDGPTGPSSGFYINFSDNNDFDGNVVDFATNCTSENIGVTLRASSDNVFTGNTFHARGTAIVIKPYGSDSDDNTFSDDELYGYGTAPELEVDGTGNTTSEVTFCRSATCKDYSVLSITSIADAFVGILISPAYPVPAGYNRMGDYIELQANGDFPSITVKLHWTSAESADTDESTISWYRDLVGYPPPWWYYPTTRNTFLNYAQMSRSGFGAGYQDWCVYGEED